MELVVFLEMLILQEGKVGVNDINPGGLLLQTTSSLLEQLGLSCSTHATQDLYVRRPLNGRQLSNIVIALYQLHDTTFNK